jgi:amphi-Trp domain-containing protein
MKKRKIKYLEERSVEACIAYLQSLIHGLKTGSVGVSQADQEIHLRPGGVIDFGLRVEQLERNESIKLEMTWRRDSTRAAGPVAEPRRAPLATEGRLATEEDEAPTLTRLPAFDESSPASEAAAGEKAQREPLSMRSLDRLAAAAYQRLYSAARTLDDKGHWHLDKERLMQSLADAGVDPLTQQELYSLALQADADGRSIMFSEQVIDALKQVKQKQMGQDPSREALDVHARA